MTDAPDTTTDKITQAAAALDRHALIGGPVGDFRVAPDTKTDRDLWAVPSAGFHAWARDQQVRRLMVAAGLRAWAAAWFDDNEDETDLPSAFVEVLDMADSMFSELDVPALAEDLED